MRRAAAVLVALLSAVLVVAPAQTAGAVHGADAHTKIVGGRDAAPDVLPGMVALLWRNRPDAFQAQFCGGTLVAPPWVLTAAHCIEDVPIDVLAGRSDLRAQGGERIAVAEALRNPGFDDSNPRDIGLLRLASAPSVPPVRLVVPGQEPLTTPGRAAVLLGWGGLSAVKEEQAYPSALQRGDVPVVDDADCAYPGLAYDPATELCGGTGQPDAVAVDSCTGDSGGPLLVTGPRGLMQAGIVSRGLSCGESATVYTAVAAYRDWIEDTTGADLASFPDIGGTTHEASIERAALAGVTAGRDDGTYGPAAPVTRGQLASFLVRALGVAPVPGRRFADTAGDVHEGAVNALAERQVVAGYGDGTFRPALAVSRGQLATFLARALGLADQAGARFSDTAGNVHEGAVNAVAAAGIATGHADGTFRPADAVSRGQLASFLVRAVLSSPPVERPAT